MPELADFPPIAQHEYRSRTDGFTAPNSTKPPKVYANAEQSPPQRKPTLIQRLTGAGRVRKANAADLPEASDEAELPGFLSRNKR